MDLTTAQGHGTSAIPAASDPVGRRSGRVGEVQKWQFQRVGDAIGDGAAAVADTGSAIGELATGAWDAIF
ncbi:hypothetical protein CH281_12340 [Rhodococcus sp. 06-221-2]|nr:hypothetical protein CH281_12340 [Rhodococcus sp. 06-221-2]